MCTCGQDIETTTHFLLHCSNHYSGRKSLFQKIYQISENISEQSDSTITKILLFCHNKLDSKTNKILLMSASDFILSTVRFSCPLIE